MIKTKIKKAIAIASIAAIAVTSFGIDAFAAKIGESSINGTWDSDIDWDGVSTTASGSVGIVVTAQVEPTLNMEISTDTINLGILTPSVEKTGSVDIEVGTNAITGVVITAKSSNGGLENTDDSDLDINAGNVGEHYTFQSIAGSDDSSISDFSSTGSTKFDIIDSTLRTIYTSNRPELTNTTDVDVEFIVGAEISEETPSGDYEDDITLVVTGTF